MLQRRALAEIDCTNKLELKIRIPLEMSENKYLDKYDFGKPIDVIPDFRWLFLAKNNDVLKFFEIFGTKRKDKIVD